MHPTIESGQVLRSALQPSAPNDAWPAIGMVACAHLLAVLGALQIDAVRAAVQEVAPTLVEFIVAPVPPRPESPPLPRPSAQPLPKVPPPQVIATVAAPQAPVATFTAPPPEPAPAVVVAAPTPVITPAPTPPAPPAAPRVLPASAVQYLVQPPVEVPLASRRLGEQGTVWLRVRVSRDGLPQHISLQKSSGYERLDRQALDAMRQARFKPQTENGQPIEWIVTAPLQYDIE